MGNPKNNFCLRETPRLQAEAWRIQPPEQFRPCRKIRPLPRFMDTTPAIYTLATPHVSRISRRLLPSRSIRFPIQAAGRPASQRAPEIYSPVGSQPCSEWNRIHSSLLTTSTATLLASVGRRVCSLWRALSVNQSSGYRSREERVSVLQQPPVTRG